MTNQLAAIPQPIESGLGAQYLGLTEIVTNHYHHDSYFVQGGNAHPRELQLFRIPQNRVGSGFTRAKTFAETSLELAGKLDRPMTVTEIRYELTPVGSARTSPATAKYLLALRANLQLVFKVNDAEACGAKPLNHYNELGFSGVTNMAAVTPEAVVGGVPTNRAEKLAVPAGIPGHSGFTVDLLLDRNMSFLADVPSGADYIVSIYLGGRFQQVEQN